MNVREDGDAHRKRATLAKLALAFGLAACWLAAAAALWRTKVPALALPALDPRDFFSARELARGEHFRSVTRTLWAAGTAVELGAAGLLAWHGRRLAALVAGPARGRIRTGVGVGLVVVLAAWLATLPLAAVAHWWSRRYGLSTQSYPAWLGDQALRLGVRGVLVSLAVAGALALAGRLGRRWWIAAAPALALLGALFILLQPVVVQPLFNRFTPLADRALAGEVERIAERMGVDIGGVETADASRRTTVPNAYVAGIGPTRRVVLYDTILDGRFARGELVAVSAHELAHVARRHLWKGVAWFALLAVPGLLVLARVTSARGGLADPAVVPLGLLLALAIFLATLPLQNAVSRRYEAEADWLALVATRDPASAIALERRLVTASHGDPDPPAWAAVWLGTHPSAVDRIAMAEAYRARLDAGRP